MTMNQSPPPTPDTMELALRESERAYRTLVETSHDLIWRLDVQGRCTFVNQAARHIYGYEPAEMLGRPFTDFESPEQARRDVAVFDHIKSGQPYFNYETVHRRKDGTPVWLNVNAVVLRDEQGVVIGATGTAQDAGVDRRRHSRRRCDGQVRDLQPPLRRTLAPARGHPGVGR
jgi:PAS domain S-box-containing protein